MMDALSFPKVALFLVSVTILYVAQKVLEFRRLDRIVEGHPGLRQVVWGGTLLGNILPSIRGISPGRNSIFELKHQLFADAGWDVISSVTAFPSRLSFSLADAAAIKDVASSRARFPKPVVDYKILQFFGDNIVASEGNEWKKYRKISAPAFSDRNNKLVWDEIVKIMEDMFANVWGTQDSITVDHAVDITLPIALFVISVAGFGRRISWNDDSDETLSSGDGMTPTFKSALHVVTTDGFLRLLLPDWVLGLTKRTRRVRQAFEELDQCMFEMIEKRRTSEKKEERHDLFTSLLDASNDPDQGQAHLTDRELIGNIFIFLVAGHETTAHTLCFTFALLALYQDQQEILYQHIKSIIPDGRVPAYEEMPLFTYSNAVFYETLRMFPPVTGIPKISAEDTTLVTSNAAGEKKILAIPQGSSVLLNVPGLHYNPRYWKDPDEFNPARFLEDWPRDAFIPFSVGARACIGRKFFETEGIAILTMLVSRYKIEIKEEPQFAAETFEERKARVLSCKPGLTITPIRVPLVFTRRCLATR